MEAQSAFVRAEGAVHLHAETAVYLDFALVILPDDAERYDAFWLHEALEQLLLFIFRVRVQDRGDGFEDFGDRVFELLLIRVALRDEIEDAFDISIAV